MSGICCRCDNGFTLLCATPIETLLSVGCNYGISNHLTTSFRKTAKVLPKYSTLLKQKMKIGHVVPVRRHPHRPTNDSTRALTFHGRMTDVQIVERMYGVIRHHHVIQQLRQGVGRLIEFCTSTASWEPKKAFKVFEF